MSGLGRGFVAKTGLTRRPGSSLTSPDLEIFVSKWVGRVTGGNFIFRLGVRVCDERGVDPEASALPDTPKRHVFSAWFGREAAGGFKIAPVSRVCVQGGLDPKASGSPGSLKSGCVSREDPGERSGEASFFSCVGPGSPGSGPTWARPRG